MGYCYDARGLLCCDACGQSGGVRKHKCPFGWCPRIALCPRCKSEHPEYLTKAYHREHGSCEENHLRYEREQAARQRILDEGKFLRCSALQHNGRVKVIFRNKDRKERAFWMAPRNYQGLGYGTATTSEDYKARGKVTKAKNTDIYDAEKYAKASA